MLISEKLVSAPEAGWLASPCTCKHSDNTMWKCGGMALFQRHKERQTSGTTVRWLRALEPRLSDAPQTDGPPQSHWLLSRSSFSEEIEFLPGADEWTALLSYGESDVCFQ